MFFGGLSLGWVLLYHSLPGFCNSLGCFIFLPLAFLALLLAFLREYLMIIFSRLLDGNPPSFVLCWKKDLLLRFW